MSGFTGGAEFAVTLQPLLHRPTFSSLPEKVGKKRRWKRIGLYRGATEGACRRTLRPAHETFSTKLHYSAACVETTLPSGAVSTQGDGKTRCCGNNRPSTYAPMVPNICVLVQIFVGADDSVCPVRLSYTFVGADAYIGPYNMLCNIVIGRVFRK